MAAYGAARHLHLEPLPRYAPDVIPTVDTCNYLIRAELGKVCRLMPSALCLAVRRGNERLRHKQYILWAPVAECGYHVRDFMQL